MVRSTVHCEREIPVEPDQLWQILGGFDISWHPDVTQCDLLRAPDGALLRVFKDKDGKLYEERRTYLSDTDKMLRYELVDGIDGVQRYRAKANTTPNADGSRVTWHADFNAHGGRADTIAKGTKAVFEAALDTLENLPIPKMARRPLLGRDHIELQTEIISGEPSLELLGGPNHDTDTLVLFLHGIGGSMTNWEQQLSVLGNHYHVAALNLRGYGRSALGDTPTTVDAYCDDIRRVMQAKGKKRLVLVGLSYGSWIATSFAMRHSDLLAGLVLAGGCTGMSEAAPQERENFRIARALPLNAGQTPADFAPAVIDMIAGPSVLEHQRAQMLHSMARITSETYRDALNCFCNPPETFDFARLSCPVLLFTGAYDKLAPPTEIRLVSERIVETRSAQGLPGDVEFEVIAGAGHICNLEAPESVNLLLHRFLSRLPGVATKYKSSSLERQREKRKRIRQAAHDEFCANGFDGASMDKIAARADVSKPTLYQYFGDKNGLMEAVLDVGRMQIIAPLLASDGPLVERLWRFSWVYADFVLRPDMLSLARLILGEAQRRPQSAIAYHQNGPERAFEGLVEFVHEAAAAEEIVVDQADLAAQNLWSLILSGPRDHYLHYVDQRPDPLGLLRSIGHGLRVFLKAYAANPKREIAVLDKLIAAKAESLQCTGNHKCQT
jgi:pimeloyl-ACP methyl ester carboxylesterase/AcrR family transcriptional regulator